MIYGDNPRKIGGRKDPLGLTVYTYAPDIKAIYQNSNLYAYCGNNPIMYSDHSGNSWTATMWWLTGVDGPLPVGDIIYGVGTLIELGIMGWMILNPPKAPDIGGGTVSIPVPHNLPNVHQLTLTYDQAVTFSKANTDNNSPTIIYRLGSGNGTNLTPREQDITGLSYQLTMPSSGSFTMITMDAINATGVLVAIKDGKNHVSVLPVDITKMQEWIDSRPTANQDPHWFTQLLQSLSIKVK